ncbi:hypothetical protein BDZ97DRAFT_1920569 [Flammula alnicola]|nr:hypothetical protein BDZ97DRAFT_1920569 [Flammula alnicola]
MGLAPIHLSTILTRTPSKLVKQLAKLSSKYGRRGHTVLFALSANFPRSEDLQVVVDQLTNFNDVIDNFSAKGKEKGPGHTIGCLSDTFASVSFEGSELHNETSRNVDANRNTAIKGPLLSCSIGIFDSAHCIPFRSTLAGRTQPQVGRWHSFRNKEDEVIGGESDVGFNGMKLSEKDADSIYWERMKNVGASEVNWENIWSQSSSSSSLSSSTLSLLPESLRTVERIQTLLTLSSPHPDMLMRTLSEYLSSSNQGQNLATSLTLVAAPTHFVTGRGVTLFMDGQIFGEGAIGVAFLRDDDVSRQKENIGDSGPTFRTQFLGVKRLSGPMTVTSREGNMINALNESNPTRLLLSALDLAGVGTDKGSSSSRIASSFKEDEQFALGVLATNREISQTYKITAGDPSSRGGSISLDAPRAPEVGSVVQFLHCPSNVPVSIPSSLFPSSHNLSQDTPPPKQVLAFLTVPEPSSNPSTNDHLTPEAESSAESTTAFHILHDTFLAPSTQGFIVSRPSVSTSTLHNPEDTTQPVEAKLATAPVSFESSWSCSLPGGVALMEWH